MLIVETGTGMAGAESYVTVAEADTYHTARGNEASWSDLDTDVKEQFLRRATDYMIEVYRQRWKGRRLNFTQALDWPRYGVQVEDIGYDRYIAYLPANSVPQAVKNACAELALRAKSGELSPDIKREVVEKTIGPIRTVYAAGAPQYVRYRAIDNLLAPMLESRLRMERA